MTTWRLFPSTNGPAAPTPFTGSFMAGVIWKLTTLPIGWFQGWWWWVPPGGDTGSQVFAFWQITGTSAGKLLASASSGPLTAGSWNWVPLASPVQIMNGIPYVACTGWTSVHGFPDTQNQFGATQPFAGGITNGPLYAYSDGTAGGTGTVAPFGLPQGLFSSTLGTDPTKHFPASGSNSANFWMDLQVSDTAPATFAGPYRLFPGNALGNLNTVLDLAVNYNVGTEIGLSQRCQVLGIPFLSLPGAASLPTRASVWSIATRQEVAALTAPAWSDIAGAGWVQAMFSTPPVLPAGAYRVSVYNANGTGGAWSPKDASTDYWGTGAGGNGIANGPLSAPGLATASLCWEYNGALPGATPPYSNGTQERGQCPFGQLPSGLDTFPELYVDGLGQNYWVDVLIQAAPVAGYSLPLFAAGGL